jgi:hypothetical protein
VIYVCLEPLRGGVGVGPLAAGLVNGGRS